MLEGICKKLMLTEGTLSVWDMLSEKGRATLANFTDEMAFDG